MKCSQVLLSLSSYMLSLLRKEILYVVFIKNTLSIIDV